MYLDTAIIVKLLVDEQDTDFFQNALAGTLLSSSELAFTEVRAALLTKERNKLISAKQRDAAWQVFTDRVQARDIDLHPLNGLVLRKANHILGRCYPKGQSIDFQRDLGGLLILSHGLLASSPNRLGSLVGLPGA